MRTVVTLLSDRNKDFYPDNNPSSFTNTLPSCIYPRRGLNRLYVRLLNACISVNTPKDGVAWIFLSEIEGNALIKPELDHCLGQVRLSTDKTGVQYQEFEHASYHRVNTIPLFRLSVKVTNHSTSPLDEGGVNLPTSITLEIMDEIEAGEHFEIVGHSLAENTSPFPFNRVSDFTIPLPYEISLDDSWEVALTGMSFPDGLVYDEYFVEVADVKYFIDVNGIRSIRQMADVIVEVFREAHVADQMTVKVTASQKYAGRKALFIRRAKLKSGEEDPYSAAGGLSVKFSRALTHFLNPYNQGPGFSARFAPGMTLMVSLGPREYRTKAPNYSPLALVYCDAVKPNIVGGELKPLLQIIPMADYLFKRETRFFQPKNLIYKDVLNKKMSSINIKFVGTHNEERYPIDVQSPNEVVIATLKFRKKQNASEYLASA